MDFIKNKIKAIIFDMDGTIIKTEDIWQGVVTNFLAEAGITNFSNKDKFFLDSLSGMGLSDASKAVKKHFALLHEVDAIVARKITLANESLVKKVDFIEGFEFFHEKLRNSNIPSSIATNARPENLSELRKLLKFERFFGENIYCVAHVNYVAKPDPALFFHAAKQLGVKPEECLVFEDSIYGFQAARAAGMKCIAIKNQYNSHLLDQVSGAIENYFEAEAMLKKIVESNSMMQLNQ
jgi:beta-phosphoglucomutase-like phosphatase (HAD superfamily)